MRASSSDRDAGKSTTIGRLLVDTGAVAAPLFARFAAQVAPEHRDSSYAWLLDRRVERERGITIDSKHREFSTPHRHVAIIDNSGHQRYVQNVAAGASQADAAVFLVSAIEYQDGAERSRGSHTHALLAFVLGVKQFIVLVNKMDAVGYEQARFDAVCDFTRTHLARLGHNASMVFIPACSLRGGNVVARAQAEMPWYTGPTLVEALDGIESSRSAADQPLRLPIDQALKVRGVGVVACGTVHYGTVRAGDQVVLAPDGARAQVRSIEVFGRAVASAGPGDDVGLCLTGVTLKELTRGQVLGHSGAAPTVMKKLAARLQMFRTKGAKFELAVGSGFQLTCHAASVQVRIAAIRWAKKDPSAAAADGAGAAATAVIRPGDQCEVDLVPVQVLAAEPYAAFPSLGRFAVLVNNELAGCGIIL